MAPKDRSVFGALLFLLILVLHLLPHVKAQTAKTTSQEVPLVSILSYEAYRRQQSCVKSCLWHPRTQDDLIVLIGCSEPWVNDCFCNPELARKAGDFITECVMSRCSSPRTAPAVTSAQSAYNSYCAANGFSIPTVASIRQFSAFASQPYCVQQCLWNPGSDHLLSAIGCRAPGENSCACNTDLVNTATAFLSDCVTRLCSTDGNAPQITAAVGVYSAYCSDAGLPVGVAIPAVVSQSFGTRNSGAIITAPTGTGESTQQDSGLSTGAIVGIALGSVAGAAALVGAAVFVLLRRRQAGGMEPVSCPDNLPSNSTKIQYPSHQSEVYETNAHPAAVEADWGAHAQPRYEMQS